MNNWKEVWLKNYNQQSDIAKWVLSTTKDTYKGDAYVPWGNMLHALYTLDENAEVVKVQNELGGFVHTDSFSIETETEGKRTVATVVSHMVIVKVKFLEKWFTEVYPIQEKDYGASKVYDQNKVNKALQRALARCISFATGIAWSLYENSTAQFEDDTPTNTTPTAPTIVVAKTTKTKVTLPPTPAVDDVVSTTPEASATPLEQLIKFLDEHKSNPKTGALVEKFNSVLSSKYSYKEKPLVIDLVQDTSDILLEKLSVVSNPHTMLDALRKAVK